MESTANHFPAMYNLIIFPGVIPRTPAKTPLVLGPRHQFPICSPAFPSFLFNETTTVIHCDETRLFMTFQVAKINLIKLAFNPMSAQLIANAFTCTWLKPVYQHSWKDRLLLRRTGCFGGAENAGVENAGVENAGVDSKGGKCRSGKCGSRQQRRKMQEW